MLKTSGLLNCCLRGCNDSDNFAKVPGHCMHVLDCYFSKRKRFRLSTVYSLLCQVKYKLYVYIINHLLLHPTRVKAGRDQTILIGDSAPMNDSKIISVCFMAVKHKMYCPMAQRHKKKQPKVPCGSFIFIGPFSTIILVMK